MTPSLPCARSRRSLGLAVGFLSIVVATSFGEPRVDFGRDVRPILSNHCFACHGPDASHREADLRLDVGAEAHAYAIQPGNAASSLMIERIVSHDPEERMPPPEHGPGLGPRQVELLRHWIDAGAEYTPFWAYETPRRTPTPPHPDTFKGWSDHWIDRYVVPRWRAEGIRPSADASPETLARRVSLDLTGLPPSEAALGDYLQAPSEKTWTAYVDRLLASPRFGERMATWWLDLVRYADTVGYHGDQDHRAWLYRDFVIEAFNRDVPFDIFARAQLAGDLEPTWEPLGDALQTAATCYHRLLQTSHEGGVQLKEYRAIYMADRVRNFTEVFMAMTGGCAQCHDHKYDPFTTRDFYALGAFFADIDDEEHLRNPYGGLNTLPSARAPEEELTLHGHRGRVMVTRALPQARTVRVLPRGNWLDESGPVVAPAVPAFLGDVAASETSEASARQPNRADLAAWLFRPRSQGGVGELTARVQVNRLWAQLFGAGLVRSLGDFGGQGEMPDHPELLDRLAMEFLQSGWRIKPLLRQIVGSRVYRLSSDPRPDLQAADPENRWLARQSRLPLAAETVRDQALAVSGLLVHQIGGPSVKPYQPAGYYVALNFPRRRYEASTQQDQWRRGVYVHRQRQFLHPMLKAFDAPTREECTASRSRSNVPTQALVLLNDPTFVEAARNLAERCLGEWSSPGGDTRAALRRVFHTLLLRAPQPDELKVLLGLWQSHRDHYRRHPQAAAALMKVGESAPASHRPADVAAWTSVARVLLSLDETLTRN